MFLGSLLIFESVLCRMSRASDSDSNTLSLPQDQDVDTFDAAFRRSTATGSISFGGGTLGLELFAMYDTPNGSSNSTAEE